MNKRLTPREIAEELQVQAENGCVRPSFSADHEGCIFRLEQYVCVDWEGNLKDTRWINVDLRGSSFKRANLDGAVFNHCALDGVEFPEDFKLPPSPNDRPIPLHMALILCFLFTLVSSAFCVTRLASDKIIGFALNVWETLTRFV